MRLRVSFLKSKSKSNFHLQSFHFFEVAGKKRLSVGIGWGFTSPILSPPIDDSSRPKGNIGLRQYKKRDRFFEKHTLRFVYFVFFYIFATCNLNY